MIETHPGLCMILCFINFKISVVLLVLIRQMLTCLLDRCPDATPYWEVSLKQQCCRTLQGSTTTCSLSSSGKNGEEKENDIEAGKIN